MNFLVISAIICVSTISVVECSHTHGHHSSNHHGSKHSCEHEHFVYKTRYANECNFAPKRWSRLNKGCKNLAINRPSPTDIKLSMCTSKNSKLQPIKLGAGWNEVVEFSFSNNGHSVTGVPSSSNGLTVSGGNLQGTYEVLQFHLHWGSVKNMEQGVGSEHVLFDHTNNRIEAALEVHVVTKKMGVSMAEATNRKTPDNLAVLAGYARLADPVVSSLGPLNAVLRNILEKSEAFIAPSGHGSSSHEAKNNVVSLRLRDVLPSDLTRFVNYDGALTTPGCNPVVQWHIFPDVQGVKKANLNGFTELFANSEKTIPLEDNFRPVQSWFGRSLRCNFVP